MNTRAIEPRNFWGLVKQNGPWKTTSVDQAHLALGYDSPHNQVQFVSPYQQDGTATIPDQLYTKRTLVDVGADGLEFSNGRIRKAKKGFDITGGITPSEPFTDNPNKVIRQPTDHLKLNIDKRPTNQLVDTTNLMQKMQVDSPASSVSSPADVAMTPTSPDVSMTSSPTTSDAPMTSTSPKDENDTSMVLAVLDSNFLSTQNPIVQDIAQVATSEKQDFRTSVAQNAWTQPATQLSTSHSASPEIILKRLPRVNVELRDPAKSGIKAHRVKTASSEELLLKRIHTNIAPLKKQSKKKTKTLKVLQKGKLSI